MLWFVSFIGKVGEWLKSPLSKSGRPVRVSRVQIPPFPQERISGAYGRDLKTLSISRGAQRARYERCTESVRFKIPFPFPHRIFF